MSDSKGTGTLEGQTVSYEHARESLSSDSAGEESKLKPANYSASKTPYTLITPVVNAYQTGSRLRTFDICGEAKSSPLFRVSVHFGFSGRGPLGSRPGIYLHNGKSIKDPVLAAAGDEDQWSQRVYAFNNKSVIVVPHLPGDDPDGPAREWVTELMVASTTSEGEGVVFRFAINIARDGKTLKRERYEWRKFKQGTDHEHPGGGFKLFWLPCPTTRTEDGNVTRPGGQGGQKTSAATGNDCVAVWELSKGLSKYWDHIFTLKFVGSGLSGDLGDRWKAMVVVTAARLWMIRLSREDE